MDDHETDADDPSATTPSDAASLRTSVADPEETEHGQGAGAFEWAVVDNAEGEQATTDVAEDDAETGAQRPATTELGTDAGAWEPSGTTMLSMAGERTGAASTVDDRAAEDAGDLGALWGDADGLGTRSENRRIGVDDALEEIDGDDFEDPDRDALEEIDGNDFEDPDGDDFERTDGNDGGSTPGRSDARDGSDGFDDDVGRLQNVESVDDAEEFEEGIGTAAAGESDDGKVSETVEVGDATAEDTTDAVDGTRGDEPPGTDADDGPTTGDATGTGRERARAKANGRSRLVDAAEGAGLDTDVGRVSDRPTDSTQIGDAADGVDGGTVDPERYLLAGEETVTTCALGRGWLVVTTHRLLAFDPESDGQRFHAVDRLNVVDVSSSGGGNATVLGYAARAALYAVVCLGGGLFAQSFGLRSLFTAGAGVMDTPGVSGLTSMLSLASVLVGLLVDGVLVAGGLAAVVAVGLGAYYLRERHSTLTVEVAGDDPVRLVLPASTDPTSTVESIRGALEPELGL